VNMNPKLATADDNGWLYVLDKYRKAS
jgi:hypothetical protein